MEYDPFFDKIVDAVFAGKNIILHGPGGTGKTWTLGKLNRVLRQHNKRVGVTATTGVAALNLNDSSCFTHATTLHRWAGIKRGDGTEGELAALVYGNKKTGWYRSDILFIDEVSMLGKKLFDKLDYVGRVVREQPDLPWGGIQLVLSGDFLQLPPVKDKFVFESKIWDLMGFVRFEFNRCNRFDNFAFFEMLLRVRVGEHTREDVDKIRSRMLEFSNPQKEFEKKGEFEIKPTILHSRRVDVDAHNERELNKLETRAICFVARDAFFPKKQRFNKDMFVQTARETIPDVIKLKEGAQVMLKVNADVEAGLVNGSRGVVVELCEEYAMVKFIRGVYKIGPYTWEFKDRSGLATRTQIPLIAAWALTIHKCVSEETRIFFESGVEKIGDLLPADAREGWHPIPEKLLVSTRFGTESTEMIYKGKESQSIVVQTAMGFTLEGSKEHPILVYSDQNSSNPGECVWKILGNISVGDSVVIKAGMNSGISPEEARDKKLEYLKLFQTSGLEVLCTHPRAQANASGFWLLTDKSDEIHLELLNLGVISSKVEKDGGKFIHLDSLGVEALINGQGVTTHCDSIVSIKESVCVMYDLSVKNDLSFISEGFVSHNCQGSTIDSVLVDLGANIFAPGQAYVALSRVKSLDDLLLSDFYEKALYADPKALQYAKDTRGKLLYQKDHPPPKSLLDLKA